MKHNLFDAWWSLIRDFRSSLVWRLLVTVLLVSCLVTVLLTALQLYRDYHRGVQQIENRLVDIERSNRDSLAEALWRLDGDQLQLELNGILRLADIRAVEIRETGEDGPSVYLSAGQRSAGPVVAREFPLLYDVQGKERQIGKLYVEATPLNLYHDLMRTAAVILVTQAANTFLVSLFIVYILSRLVMRHVAAIARTAENYDFREAPQPFSLQRRKPRQPDELDRVANAFNAMGARLYYAHRDEQDAAAEREARALAEAANRAKGEFLANMSHELRTPLNGILGYAQILERDATLSGRQRERVAAIRNSGEHLLTLIEDTLDFARIEAGKLRVEIGDVALAGFVDIIREIIEVKAEQKRLEFVCEIAEDAPDGVRADERRLRQVMLNLLSNAVKFTDSGCVSLRISRSESRRVRFEVRDTGIGIASDQLNTIFEPFEQLGAAERRAGGAGLGLAISRQFVHAMGGEIEVESRIGQGSSFRFELPPASGLPGLRKAADAAPIPYLATGYEGPRRKVLVVDDIEVNRAIAVHLLSRLGFDTVEAENGREGFEKALREQPALILTDIVMPEMNGLDLTRKLRELHEFAHVPIIVMSASPCGTNKVLTLEAGGNAFLPKPVDLDALLAQIAALLGLKWIYASSLPPSQRAATPEISLAAVPRQQMEELHHLARLGDMHEIIAWAENMAVRDSRYRSFTTPLCALARDYQSKAILHLVERHLNGEPKP
ncbi:Integral membrane sensor hybrid histidine kinase [Paraburkholderia ribeironis]|uniref:Sensory/regulatory protein RpfC n=1 Tax=Paraburkholderia ribeironis TaxID=1247936 RepID=A0A1N7RRP4_9BURK|nr:ATP-binding protein [Paraburkholderia ribeironis]SIT37352.1 Integral membrane sensor hybrid histidine kinase [Paraburkholderia ribeironis]